MLFSGGKKKKKSTCQCRRARLYPWVLQMPWRRKWQPTLVFLPGESHGQRSLGSYSPWVCRVRHDQARMHRRNGKNINTWALASRELEEKCFLIFSAQSRLLKRFCETTQSCGVTTATLKEMVSSIQQSLKWLSQESQSKVATFLWVCHIVNTELYQGNHLHAI